MKKGLLHSDDFWGPVLIVLGFVALAYHPFEKMDAAITGSTDKALSYGLIVIAVVTLGIAFYARPSLKALAIVWIVTP